MSNEYTDTNVIEMGQAFIQACEQGGVMTTDESPRMHSAFGIAKPAPVIECIPAPTAEFDVVGFIMDLEGGADLTEDEVIAGFQHLVDTGQAWSLQGFYGRTAQRLIDMGLVTR